MILGLATDVADTHEHIAQLEIFNCILANLMKAIKQRTLSTS